MRHYSEELAKSAAEEAAARLERGEPDPVPKPKPKKTTTLGIRWPSRPARLQSGEPAPAPKPKTKKIYYIRNPLNL